MKSIEIPKGFEQIKLMRYGEKSFKQVLVDSKGRRRVRTLNRDVSMTDQSFAPELDNRVVFENLKKGRLPMSGIKQGHYIDLSDAPDNLMDAQIQLQATKRTFDGLDPKVKEVVKSPQGLVKFVNDPRNYKKALELGLIVPKQNVSDESNGGASGTHRS